MKSLIFRSRPIHRKILLPNKTSGKRLPMKMIALWILMRVILSTRNAKGMRKKGGGKKTMDRRTRIGLD
jgi:hypothetical protein